jgi:U6 snRNA-associated Sm-like protein LSm2
MQQLKQYFEYYPATDNYSARSFFKTLTNQVVTIELKNDIRIRGTLKSVDQYLNIKLDDIDVLDLDKYPHLSSVKNMFIRGSVVRYVVLPRSEVDVGLLEDATRRGTSCTRTCLIRALLCCGFV